MRLNQKGKKELREKVETALSNVPLGQRIHLDKDILEELLFDTIVCNKETGETVKLPVWSGKFLRHLDLSEISFDNVSWSLLSNKKSAIVGQGEEYFDPESYTQFCKSEAASILGVQGRVNYSKTNAKIDFSKSWDAKHGDIVIYCCDFSGVDLSNNDMSQLLAVYYSDLSYTKLILSQDMFEGKNNVFLMTNLQGINLRDFTVNAKEMVEENDPLFDMDCNFSDTGINIIVDSGEMGFSDSETSKKRFHDLVVFGFLDGCYINGKKVLSSSEQKAMAEKKKSEYEDMKRDYIASVLQTIEEQKRGFGSK